MVYCNYDRHEGNTVFYKIGGSSKDITGELAIYLNDKTYELLKEPENSKVYDRHIHSMLYWALPELLAGKFPPKLSYEI